MEGRDGDAILLDVDTVLEGVGSGHLTGGVGRHGAAGISLGWRSCVDRFR